MKSGFGHDIDIPCQTGFEYRLYPTGGLFVDCQGVDFKGAHHAYGKVGTGFDPDNQKAANQAAFDWCVKKLRIKL